MLLNGNAFTSIYTLHTWSRTQTHCGHQEPSTGAFAYTRAGVAQFGSMRLCTGDSVHHGHLTRHHSHRHVLHARRGLPPSGHVGAEQASSCCRCSDARMAA